MLSRLRELKAMAAKLSATARQMPPGRDRDDAYREVAKFRDKISAFVEREKVSFPKSPLGDTVTKQRPDCE
jgi:hypothetical protein